MSDPITLTERPELEALIAAAVVVAKAMSPEARAAMMEAQRQSWVRGEQGLRATETKREAMSDPITLTERERAARELLAKHNSKMRANVLQGTDSGMVFVAVPVAVAAIMDAESASPPRVPVSSAHPGREGVQSGPGQPIDSLVTLDECPPGLFLFGEDNTLCFKSEYSTTQAKSGAAQCDAYVVSSGEYFWGGAMSAAERAVLKVRPVDIDAIRALADKPAPSDKGG